MFFFNTAVTSGLLNKYGNKKTRPDQSIKQGKKERDVGNELLQRTIGENVDLWKVATN
jgi:hypothetical protein